MVNLCKGHSSKENLAKESAISPQTTLVEIEKQLEQNTLADNEVTVVGEIAAKRFIENIYKMRNPHIRGGVSLSEKYGSIEDYSECHEHRDLKRYKRFINSSAYDDVKEVKSQVVKRLTRF